MRLPHLPRRYLATAVIVVLLVLAGVAVALRRAREQPTPSVSLRAGQVGVRVEASRWCPEGKKCQTHRREIPVLRLSGTSDVVIEVDGQVKNRPWLVLVDGSSAGPLQRRSASYQLTAVTGPLLVEVVTVDTDGNVVLQRDRWIFKIESR